jgi:F-type H+-transporting ATPase subunit alpha
VADFAIYRDQVGEVGYVLSVTSSLIYASGLPGARVGEKVITEKNEVGLIQTLEQSMVEILMFNSDLVDPGSQIARTNEAFSIPVGKNFLGRAVDPLSNSIDSENPVIQEDEWRVVTPEVPGISVRSRLTEPFQTGVAVIDTLVPLGLGQREVIIGDSKSGKTAFLLQAILNQKGKDVICIYVAAGKKKADIREIEEFITQYQLQDYTMIVGADAAATPGLVYLAPLAGMTHAEYFRDLGKNVLVIIDDLTTHAKFYREIALQGRKTPGREGYPGDIYFLHSHLLERAGKFKLPWGVSPTITCLPVVESINGDFTGFIPTNIMSMTDGHIFFDTDLMQKGQIPGVDVFLSVSRVGNQTRINLEKEINFEIRNLLSQYRSTLTFSRFGVELSDVSKNLIRNGEKLNTLFNQSQNQVISPMLRLLLLSLLVGGFWDSKMDVQVGEDKEKLIAAYQQGKLKTIEAQLAKIKTLAEMKDFIKVNFSVFLKLCA